MPELACGPCLPKAPEAPPVVDAAADAALAQLAKALGHPARVQIIRLLVDPQLIRFAADLEWLGDQGGAVERFNLAQQPQAFASDPAVRAALYALGDGALPLIRVGADIKSTGLYPDRQALAAWVGLASSATPCCGPSTPAPQSGGCC